MYGHSIDNQLAEMHDAWFYSCHISISWVTSSLQRATFLEDGGLLSMKNAVSLHAHLDGASRNLRHKPLWQATAKCSSWHSAHGEDLRKMFPSPIQKNFHITTIRLAFTNTRSGHYQTILLTSTAGVWFLEVRLMRLRSL